MTRVLLTVDTALGWAAHARGECWQDNLSAAFDPRLPEAIAGHGLKACFFVDPMPALVYGLEPIRRMVEPILAAGQEVQLLLHPVWQSVAEGVAEGARFELTCFDAEDQLDLIETARDLLVEAGAPPPIAFRSGGFAADVRTLAALVEVGLSFDSSHNGGRHPRAGALPLEPDLTGPVDIGGLIEVPVSLIEEAPGRLLPLQLGSVPGAAIEAALRGSRRSGRALVTLVGDSAELCGRFERLCGFLAARAEKLPTVHFADLQPPSAAAGGEPPPPHDWHAARGLAGQAWPKPLYQRSL